MFVESLLKFFFLTFFQQLDSLQLTGPPKAKDETDKDRWDDIFNIKNPWYFLSLIAVKGCN